MTHRRLARPTLLACTITILALLPAACSSRGVYDSAQGWRQQQCDKMLDNTARARCLEEANRDYDSYRKQQ